MAPNSSVSSDGVPVPMTVLRRGEVVALIGPSGSGKSTLVRCIHQLAPIDGGSIHVHGELQGCERTPGGLRMLSEAAIARQRQRIGMVFQQFNLFPHMTVLRNVMEGPVQVLGVSPAEARERAVQLLTRVGLADRIDAWPRQLSGGQQQRVAIARALIADPTLIVADEPTGDLDRTTAGEILDLLGALNQELGKTIVMVTHDPKAASRAGRLIHLEKGVLVPDDEVQADPH